MDDFFYDGQIRRYIVQFIRIFSGISIETGPDSNGVVQQKRVPVIYGEPSWQGAQIVASQTQNTLHPVPLMAATISSFEMAPDRRHTPTHESKMHRKERKMVDGKYIDEPGKSITVERYMPVPYDITMRLDIWTSNKESKLQILEQILTWFNPAIQLQQTDNPIDWTSLFEVELTNIEWTNVTLPTGSDDREIASLEFKIGVWINPPAKIIRSRLIHQIVTNVNAVKNLSEAEISSQIEDPMAGVGELLSQSIVTPGNYKVSIGNDDAFETNELVLLTPEGKTDETVSWKDLLDAYGYIDPAVTRVRLKLEQDIEDYTNDILGTVEYTDNPNILKIEIDPESLPSSTLGTIIGMIDPQITYPGMGLNNPEIGDQYIVVSENSDYEEYAVAEDHPYWGTFEVNVNDVIRYNGNGEWEVVLDSVEYEDVEYATHNGDLLKFENRVWSFYYYGVYAPGYWRIENLIEDSGATEYLKENC